MMKRLVLCLCLVAAWPVAAHEYLFGDLVIIHPHARPAETTSAGFLEVFNGASAQERLLGVRTDVADISFFDAAARGGQGQRSADPIVIAAGQSVSLAPDAVQIRLSGLEAPLRIGDKFLVTLVFENAGPVTVEFWVEGGVQPQIAATPKAQNPVPEAPDVTQILQSILGAEVQIVATAVSGANAVAGWTANGESGRAFLKQRDGAWRVTALSGASLITSAGLRAQGLSPRAAQDLRTLILQQEADLPATSLARLDSFQGTILAE